MTDQHLSNDDRDVPGHFALYYPFHLCSPESLARFLTRYDTLHFRDYMALQLTPTSGMMAYPDRMGDTHPELLAQGRIAQGHNVSGPLSAELDNRVSRDLKDRSWRDIFHLALRSDLRFQRGLAPQGTPFMPWMSNHWLEWPVTLADIRQMSRLKLEPDAATRLEYGLMLIKTSASLWYTIKLCQQYKFEAVTDSVMHERLLRQIMARDQIDLQTFLLRQ